ncbi:hypothetical protein, partial [[Clostridium] scindens]|uniref:hypothetical protein n=1 Tax=Clostridium scindens (strain JCM 10418 / VPI 12708) TaxID=29347 RepID=UPI001FB61AA5
FHYYLCRQLKGGGMEIIMNEKGDLIGSLCSDNPTIMEKHYIQEVGAIAKKMQPFHYYCQEGDCMHEDE